jgi:hypothetical protein
VSIGIADCGLGIANWGLGIGIARAIAINNRQSEQSATNNRRSQ